MPRDSGGTASLPGGAFITGTVISSTVMNQKFADLTSMMTDSLSRTGLGGMLAPLEVPDGSAALPSLTWGSDPGTGFWLPSIGMVRLTSSAATLQQWTTTAVTINPAFSATGGTTATNGTTNGAALTATGNGTGSGVVTTGGATGAGITASGGSTSGSGGMFTGTGGGTGITATGQGAGAGVSATGGATNAPGVVGLGVNLGEGGRFTGGTGGIGVRGTGTNNHGGVLTGGTGGAGAILTGGTGQPGAIARNGTTATSGTPQIGLLLDTSYLSLDGSAIPTSTTAIKNMVTSSNIPKMLALLTTNSAAGAQTISGGFNLTGASVATTTLTLTFASPMLSTNYGVFITGTDGDLNFFVSARATGSVSIQATQTTGTTAGTVTRNSYNFQGNITTVNVLVVGPQ